jgi:hypothetical protein
VPCPRCTEPGPEILCPACVTDLEDGYPRTIQRGSPEQVAFYTYLLDHKVALSSWEQTFVRSLLTRNPENLSQKQLTALRTCKSKVDIYTRKLEKRHGSSSRSET